MDEEWPKIIWAKMAGFAIWPARYCSKFESDDLRKKVPPKGNKIAAVFMERKIKRAWVNEASIEEFNLSSLSQASGFEHFSPKTFENNSNYRVAVMEAVRVLYNSKAQSSSETVGAYNLALQLIHKFEPGFPGKVRDGGGRIIVPETCEICQGTINSGELRPCCVTEPTEKGNVHCNGKGRVHFHCLQPIERIDVNERWFCKLCCENNDWQPGVLMPADDSLVPFFGTIDRYMAASELGEDDQMYHVTYDDGDGEEYFEHELHLALDLFDKFKSPEHNRAYRSKMFSAAWEPRAPHSGAATAASAKGKAKRRTWESTHPAIGSRVCKYFVGEMVARGSEEEQREVRDPLASFEIKVEAEEECDYSEPVQETITENREEGSCGAQAVQPVDPLSAVPITNVNATHIPLVATADGAAVSIDSRSGSGSGVTTTSAAALSTDEPSVPFTTSLPSKRTRDLNVPTTTSEVVSGKTRAASRPGEKRATILLDEPVELQKRRLQAYKEGQVETKRKLEKSSSSSSSGSGSGGSSSGKNGTINRYLVSTSVIKKKPKMIEEDDVPLTNRSYNSNNSNNNSISANPAPLQPASACRLAENAEYVRFIDDCLVVVQQHRDNMLRSRRIVLGATKPLTVVFSHSIVEGLAQDIVNIVERQKEEHLKRDQK